MMKKEEVNPRLIKRQFLDRLDSVERIVAQKFILEGRWVLEEVNK